MASRGMNARPEIQSERRTDIFELFIIDSALLILNNSLNNSTVNNPDASQSHGSVELEEEFS